MKYYEILSVQTQIEASSILENLDLPNWQGSILMKALEFKFIAEIDVELALEVLKPFNSEDDFYYACADNYDLDSFSPKGSL